MNEAAARRPRLTDQILDDLTLSLQTWNDEIDYLNDAIAKGLGADLLARFKTKREALARSRDWLSRHIEATRSQRGSSEQDLFNSDAAPAAVASNDPNLA